MNHDFYSDWVNRPKWTIQQLVCLLNGYDPAVLDTLTDEENSSVGQFLLQEFRRWELWAGDCPGINDQKDQWGVGPHILVRPIDAEILVNWASKKSGVKIPRQLESLLYSKNPENADTSLGHKEKENLLMTIALLALAVAEGSGNNTGNFDKPNYSGIADICIKHADGIAGMAKSTLINRMSQGMKLLRE